MGRGTLGEVKDVSVYPQRSLGRVTGPQGSSGTSEGCLGEVRDGSGDPPGCPGRVGEPSGLSGTGQGTLGEVRNGSRDPRGVPGRVKAPSGRFGTGQGTLRVVRDGSEAFGEVRDGLGDLRVGPEPVGPTQGVAEKLGYPLGGPGQVVEP